MSEREDKQFENLLYYLQQNRGFDFTGYKRPSLMRRVIRRMQMLGVDAFADYIDFLEVHPEEFSQLFNTILINVTSFFRDPGAWEYLAAEIIPRILRGKDAAEPIRVWSAGCASGEEAYTTAMVLADAMGIEAFRQRVKIYATDVDEEALTLARQASYAARDLQPVSQELRSKYFERNNGRSVFRADLRRCVIFRRHDLVQDAPISRVDLLISRNTTMYFNAKTQARILARYHFALNETGYLFMGRAELLLTHANLFSPMDLKGRIFAKVPLVNARDRILAMGQIGNNDMAKLNHAARIEKLREMSYESSPVARISVDANGNLALANQRARVLFSLNPKDIGRHLQDLEISYRPVELHSLIEQAYSERRAITLTSMERRFTDTQAQYLDITVMPLHDERNSAVGVEISFQDVTSYHRLQAERFKEEVQTSSEELQSSNEELETTNEELQSTNEELETMNEELHSTNEDLQTLNEELRQRTDELNHSNAFLESVVSSLSAGAVVINQQYNILVWNHRAEDMWGLREYEVKGQSLFNLDIGLPVDRLRGMIRACLNDVRDPKDLVLNAVNRRGKAIQCRVSCSPLLVPNKQGQGVILLMDAKA